ncbi:MAG TPA: HlyD family secretion protein [Anaeromyxobacteraceae bacterium]|nr:HlyD family secretion protein [Anaeromyxobacteraceae bacterium]
MSTEVGPTGSAENGAAPAADAKKKRALRLRVGLGIALVLLGVLGWWLYERRYEDTDDAQIDGNLSAISPRVSGTVVSVPVVDNQEVKAGDVLVEIDPTDLEVALAQAEAAVAQAEAQLAAEHPTVPITESSNRSAVETAAADVESAQSDVDAAKRDLDQAVANDRLAQLQLTRGKELLVGESISQSDYDQRVAAAAVTTAAVAAAEKRLEGKRAHLESALAHQQEVNQNAPRQLMARQASVLVRQANLEVARAQLRQARLNLGYTRVVAPADGIIGRKGVNVGDRIQPGQQLFALTQTGDLWVTANFRETQVRHMRAGQPVEVHVDALDRDFKGRVESFAGATGSRYSLLPPENASGNYVKVVQRLPVRIRLEPGQPEMGRLRPGMSVEPKVKIR